MLVIATYNEGKADELRMLLKNTGCGAVLSLTEASIVMGLEPLLDVVEDGYTLEENAIKKAMEYATQLQMPVVADDSGLFVDALDGAPGVYSGRWGGAGGQDDRDAVNNAKLLEKLKGVPVDLRTAQFCTVLAVADPSGALGEECHLAHGEVEGAILKAPRGDNGHAYDTLFRASHMKKSMAELTQAEKNTISHRGRAFQSLMPFLISYFPD